jgi:hypothetical protein
MLAVSILTHLSRLPIGLMLEVEDGCAMKGHFGWTTSFPNCETTITFKSGAEKVAPRIFKFVEAIKILDQIYEENFSREELDFLVEAVKLARIDIKNKNCKLRVVK